MSGEETTVFAVAFTASGEIGFRGEGEERRDQAEADQDLEQNCQEVPQADIVADFCGTSELGDSEGDGEGDRAREAGQSPSAGELFLGVGAGFGEEFEVADVLLDSDAAEEA